MSAASASRLPGTAPFNPWKCAVSVPQDWQHSPAENSHMHMPSIAAEADERGKRFLMFMA